MDDDAQRAGGGDTRILLPQRSGGRVARVGERGPTCLDQGRVQLLEARDREVDLTADLEQLWRVPVQPSRDDVDGADVRGHVLAGTSVAARRCPDEPATLVDQVDRDTVDLELGNVGRLGVADLALDASRPRDKLVIGEDVVEAHHPLEMIDRRELCRDDVADLLRRRVGCA